MNRRDIIKAAAVMGTAAFATTVASYAASMTRSSGLADDNADSLSAQKKWARENMRGIENILLPSFHPDLTTVDEDALRIEVRNTAAQGFCSTAVFPVWVKESDPRWRPMSEVIIDECRKNALFISAGAGGRVANGAKPVIDRLLLLESMGFSHVLLSFYGDSSTSEEALYEMYRECAESTALPIILYANIQPNMRHLGPQGIPVGVFKRLAALPNIVAIKISQPVDLTTTFRICDQLSESLLCAPVNLDFVPLLSRSFSNIQYSGQWCAEAVQTPGNPLAVNLMSSVIEKDFNKAFATYEQMQAAIQEFYRLQAPTIVVGGHPWLHLKYYSWLGGGNGGLLPDLGKSIEQVPPLTAADRRTMRQAFQRSGLPINDADEEEFIVGRAAWARGVRVNDFQTHPLYIK
ncbi:dihydrodipicolinate synthase [Spongiibacter sp. KMU-166]|uniref:Dihydrodipicolinate synthase n=1 Tax=Spongiibacter thalassae TaxID=2721624 RepID=A0ABX1GC73_9GAMM|nr:dihydrodipicolinate synthase [Spongiibacter thalassae]